MAGTISEGKKADTDLVIYNDYPSLELDLRKPGINTGTTIYFNEGDSGYLQTFILIEDRQYEPAGYNASVSSLIATNIATGKTTTYDVDSSVNSGTNIGAFSVPNEITETAGAYECYLTFKSDKGNYSSPRWIYQVVSASNGTAIDLPEATAEQLENKLNGKISELRDNVVSLSNKIDHSVAIDTSDFIHAEQFNAYKTDTDTKIQAIKTTDEKQSNDIVTNKNNIAQNTSDISSLKSDMSSVKSDISTAQDNIKALQDKQPTDVSPDLTQIKSDIKSVQDDTKQNSKDIATLSADDSALQEKVADIQNTQSNHTSDITQLQSDLKSVQNTANNNKQDIAKNKIDIATNKQDIKTINEKLATINTGSSSSGDAKVPQQVIDDVAQNKKDVAQNKADINTNSDNIATNTTDIAHIKNALSSDESQISTNTTNISQNEQDIANLKKSSKELSDKVANLPAPDDAALLKLHTIVDTNTHNISDNAQNITTINQKLAKMPTATDLANVTSTATDAKNTATEAKQQATDNATNIATLTDKVSKIKQPDLSDYAKKSDLPADNNAQVSKNTTDIATNKADISQNTTDIANLTNKVNNIHLPNLSPYLKSSDAAETYLTTATASETYAKLTDLPADKSADIAKNKQDIATINDKIKTLVVPDLSSYLTKTAADSTYAKKTDIPDTSNFITTTDADKKYATVQQAHKESQDAMKYAAMMGAKVEGELSPVSQTASQASSQATTNAGDIYELQNDVSNIRTSISNIPTGGFKLIHTLDPNSDFYGMVDSAGNLKKDCFWITDSGCAFMGQKGNSYFDRITENSFIPVKQTDTDITNTYLVSTNGSLSKATHNLDYYKFAISGVPIDHSNSSTWNFDYDKSSDTLTITINATYIASNIWSFLWNSNWMYNGTQYLLSTIYLSSGYVKLIIPAQFQSLPNEIFLSDTSSATTITINNFLATTGNSGKTMGGGSVLFNSNVDAIAVNGSNAMGYDD